MWTYPYSHFQWYNMLGGFTPTQWDDTLESCRRITFFITTSSGFFFTDAWRTMSNTTSPLEGQIACKMATGFHLYHLGGYPCQSPPHLGAYCGIAPATSLPLPGASRGRPGLRTILCSTRVWFLSWPPEGAKQVELMSCVKGHHFKRNTYNGNLE